jgi:hypothetical protein
VRTVFIGRFGVRLSATRPIVGFEYLSIDLMPHAEPIIVYFGKSDLVHRLTSHENGSSKKSKGPILIRRRGFCRVNP